MNIHTFLDRATVAMGGVYGDSLRFFRESVESPHVSEIIRQLDVSVPPVAGPGEQRVEFSYAGATYQTAYTVYAWVDRAAPTVIFHHGSGDFPYARRIETIFPQKRVPNGVNLIATNIPFNLQNKLEYIKAVGSLENFTLMFAAATSLIQGLVQELRTARCRFISVSGISLGGWIANMHKAYFDSADEYRPVFAGAAPDHLFRETVYAKMVASSARHRGAAVSAALNFEKDFVAADAGNVYPLMAQYDQYILLERQAQIYHPENISVIPYGHVTGTTQNQILAEHIAGGVVLQVPGSDYSTSNQSSARHCNVDHRS